MGGRAGRWIVIESGGRTEMITFVHRCWTPGKAAALFEAGGDQVIEAVDWFAG